MTEIMLMLPLIFVFMMFMTRIFFLLVLVQKMEIASYYAARRYQLQSHRNSVKYNDSQLEFSIQSYVKEYLGENKFPGLGSVDVDFEATQVWRIVTIKATVETLSGGVKSFLCDRHGEAVCNGYSNTCHRGYSMMCTSGGYTLESVKYVAPRDRYLEFELPGLSP